MLDVRRDGEWQGGHIDGAQHIPLHQLAGRLNEVSDHGVWVHCASGYRASIAASILDAAGNKITAVSGDSGEAEQAGLPITA